MSDDPPVVEFQIPEEPEPVRSDLPAVERFSRRLIGYAWGLLGLLAIGVAMMARDGELRMWLLALAAVALGRLALIQWLRMRRRRAAQDPATGPAPA